MYKTGHLFTAMFAGVLTSSIKVEMMQVPNIRLL